MDFDDLKIIFSKKSFSPSEPIIGFIFFKNFCLIKDSIIRLNLRVIENVNIVSVSSLNINPFYSENIIFEEEQEIIVEECSHTPFRFDIPNDVPCSFNAIGSDHSVSIETSVFASFESIDGVLVSSKGANIIRISKYSSDKINDTINFRPPPSPSELGLEEDKETRACLRLPLISWLLSRYRKKKKKSTSASSSIERMLTPTLNAASNSNVEGKFLSHSHSIKVSYPQSVARAIQSDTTLSKASKRIPLYQVLPINSTTSKNKFKQKLRPWTSKPPVASSKKKIIRCEDHLKIPESHSISSNIDGATTATTTSVTAPVSASTALYSSISPISGGTCNNRQTNKQQHHKIISPQSFLTFSPTDPYVPRPNSDSHSKKNKTRINNYSNTHRSEQHDGINGGFNRHDRKCTCTPITNPSSSLDKARTSVYEKKNTLTNSQSDKKKHNNNNPGDKNTSKCRIHNSHGDSDLSSDDQDNHLLDKFCWDVTSPIAYHPFAYALTAVEIRVQLQIPESSPPSLVHEIDLNQGKVLDPNVDDPPTEKLLQIKSSPMGRRTSFQLANLKTDESPSKSKFPTTTKTETTQRRDLPDKSPEFRVTPVSGNIIDNNSRHQSFANSQEQQAKIDEFPSTKMRTVTVSKLTYMDPACEPIRGLVALPPFDMHPLAVRFPLQQVTNALHLSSSRESCRDGLNQDLSLPESQLLKIDSKMNNRENDKSDFLTLSAHSSCSSAKATISKDTPNDSSCINANMETRDITSCDRNIHSNLLAESMRVNSKIDIDDGMENYLFLPHQSKIHLQPIPKTNISLRRSRSHLNRLRSSSSSIISSFSGANVLSHSAAQNNDFEGQLNEEVIPVKTVEQPTENDLSVKPVLDQSQETKSFEKEYSDKADLNGNVESNCQYDTPPYTRSRKQANIEENISLLGQKLLSEFNLSRSQQTQTSINNNYITSDGINLSQSSSIRDPGSSSQSLQQQQQQQQHQSQFATRRLSLSSIPTSEPILFNSSLINPLPTSSSMTSNSTFPRLPVSPKQRVSPLSCRLVSSMSSVVHVIALDSSFYAPPPVGHYSPETHRSEILMRMGSRVTLGGIDELKNLPPLWATALVVDHADTLNHVSIHFELPINVLP